MLEMEPPVVQDSMLLGIGERRVAVEHRDDDSNSAAEEGSKGRLAAADLGIAGDKVDTPWDIEDTTDIVVGEAVAAKVLLDCTEDIVPSVEVGAAFPFLRRACDTSGHFVPVERLRQYELARSSLVALSNRQRCC